MINWLKSSLTAKSIPTPLHNPTHSSSGYCCSPQSGWSLGQTYQSTNIVKLASPSACTFNKDSNLLLGRAKFNFDLVYDLILTDSSRGADCPLCSSSSSLSSSSISKKSSVSSSSSSSVSPSPKVVPPSSSSSSSSSESPSAAPPPPPSSSSSSSSESPSAAPPPPPSSSSFNTYEAHPCGHYCPTNCNQWTDISGQGIDIKVPRLKDQGGLIKCYQPWYANSSIMITLYYKFAYINFPSGSTYSDGCYLLLKKKCDGPNIPELLPSLNKKYSNCDECLSSYPSSSSSSAAEPPAVQHEYEMYPCGTWTAMFCNQFYTYTGGVPIKVPVTRDVANTICPQNDGSTLEYKITTVKRAANSSPICALLIEKSGLINPSAIYSTDGLFNNCETCTPPPPLPSPSSSSLSSSSSSFSSSPSPSPSYSPAYSSELRCYTARSSNVGNVLNEPGVGTNWQTYWKQCKCCPPCCSASASWGAGNQYHQGNLVRLAPITYNTIVLSDFKTYTAFKCGGSEIGFYDGNTECNKLYRKASAIGQGFKVLVKKTIDLPNYTCQQLDGSITDWKICKVKWQNGTPIEDGCFLFVIQGAGNTPAPMTAAPMTATPIITELDPVIEPEPTIAKPVQLDLRISNIQNRRSKMNKKDNQDE